MMTSPYEKYRQSSVQTSTPAQLLIMSYDGVIRFVRLAMEALSKRDFEKTNLNFGKAQTIMSELTCALNFNYEISKNLFSLYEYINHLLVEANIHKTPDKAEEALGYLTDLRETWLQASKIAAGQGQAESAHG
ncbi:flagellar export chaperone FliS [Paenibacillus odorifer]|jgi:flagellar protein FliS|uniref:flagellar export chaperone FliS n=1 Tax=Paenibacillus TaxID=44249 RepID=UPI00096CE14D|nr:MULTISPECIES: flagellar export chaperone FliS [Paenibacillus]MDH6428689.1 flagellar protein FliS [Paenibacillus sp. PastH-4]MDH6444890.1 flagellar protein FliS [Paenibacillus sp. PastF-4]MDH6528784.1 flagellar protein FliS [Paenibacillus sp. PastH-3]OMD68525.1 flagellar export chaperone FliS [Paenibacillus odorifer]